MILFLLLLFTPFVFVNRFLPYAFDFILVNSPFITYEALAVLQLFAHKSTSLFSSNLDFFFPPHKYSSSFLVKFQLFTHNFIRLFFKNSVFFSHNCMTLFL